MKTKNYDSDDKIKLTISYIDNTECELISKNIVTGTSKPQCTDFIVNDFWYI